MVEKQSKISSVFGLKCPHCHQTSMFVNPTLFAYKKMGDTKDHCDVCGTNLKPESGFYFGAAYVSWGLTVALWISVLVALKVFDALDWIEFGFLTHPITFLLSGMVVTLIVFPYLYRLSRSIWAHMFIKSKIQNVANKNSN